MCRGQPQKFTVLHERRCVSSRTNPPFRSRGQGHRTTAAFVCRFPPRVASSKHRQASQPSPQARGLRAVFPKLQAFEGSTESSRRSCNASVPAMSQLRYYTFIRSFHSLSSSVLASARCRWDISNASSTSRSSSPSASPIGYISRGLCRDEMNSSYPGFFSTLLVRLIWAFSPFPRFIRCNHCRNSGTGITMIAACKLTSYIFRRGKQDSSAPPPLCGTPAHTFLGDCTSIGPPDLQNTSGLECYGRCCSQLDFGDLISAHTSLIDSTHSGSAAVTGGSSCCCVRRSLLSCSRSDCEPPRICPHIVPALFTH